MSCPTDSRTITLIEPDNLVLTATSSGSSDQSLDEHGEKPLFSGQTSVTVAFLTPKAGDYRFEYLYVDDMGEYNPGVVSIVPITQTPYGFSVELAGVPIATGYVLRWRVVVIAIAGIPVQIDAPENLYVRLPLANTALISFVNPRSTTAYGFSELRVENLTDSYLVQVPILAQVAQKTVSNFRVALSPRPPTANYFLVARTP